MPNVTFANLKLRHVVALSHEDGTTVTLGPSLPFARDRDRNPLSRSFCWTVLHASQ